ncbi:hypothetical protein Q8A67_023408 [Cirrhinus molitorella]|uniref:Uncharacterized protein n=1 Tax=Cirrhinus molitorella TaxID=172907 RepID=A0AA88NZV7_9TELE|nr:hypothetical protein Q8A67_023408 [Cirrhinus molitorella]
MKTQGGQQRGQRKKAEKHHRQKGHRPQILAQTDSQAERISDWLKKRGPLLFTERTVTEKGVIPQSTFDVCQLDCVIGIPKKYGLRTLGVH